MLLLAGRRVMLLRGELLQGELLLLGQLLLLGLLL